MANRENRQIKSWRDNSLDRVFINELYKSYSRGKSSDEQGGYYFPGGLSEAEIAAPGYDVSTGKDNAKFSVKNDLLAVVKDLRSRKLVALA